MIILSRDNYSSPKNKAMKLLPILQALLFAILCSQGIDGYRSSYQTGSRLDNSYGEDSRENKSSAKIKYSAVFESIKDWVFKHLSGFVSENDIREMFGLPRLPPKKYGISAASTSLGELNGYGRSTNRTFSRYRGYGGYGRLGSMKRPSSFGNSKLGSSVSKCDAAKPNKKHPKDCTKFYHCGVLKTCGPGTFFNPKHMVCDWPYNVVRIRPECKKQQKKSGSQNQRIAPSIRKGGGKFGKSTGRYGSYGKYRGRYGSYGKMKIDEDYTDRIDGYSESRLNYLVKKAQCKVHTDVFSECPPESVRAAYEGSVVLSCKTHKKFDKCIWISPTMTKIQPVIGDKTPYQIFDDHDTREICSIKLRKIKIDEFGVWKCGPIFPGKSEPDAEVSTRLIED